MALNPLQWRHTKCVALLILYMEHLGYHPRQAYALRSKDEAKRLGFENSNHTRYLAVDIDLFDSNGNYLPSTEDHRKFGEFWKTLDPLARWGGAWGDGNHYSFEYKGVK